MVKDARPHILHLSSCPKVIEMIEDTGLTAGAICQMVRQAAVKQLGLCNNKTLYERTSASLYANIVPADHPQVWSTEFFKYA